MGIRLTPWERLQASAWHEETDVVPVHVNDPHITYKVGSGIDTVARYPESIHLISVGRGVDPTTFGSVLDERSKRLDADWWAPLLQDVDEYWKLHAPSREELLPRLLKARDGLLVHYPPDVRRRYNGGGWTAAISGPMDLACRLMGSRGYEKLLKGFYRSPQSVHRLFETITEANIEWVRLCIKVLGDVDVLHFADHGLALISPKHFETFGLPYWSREVQAAPREALVWYHNEGDVTHLLDAVPRMGVHIFEFGWVSIEEAKRRIGDRVCLCGNIHPVTTLLHGSREDVTRECRKAIDVAAPGGGYILSDRGGLAPGTPIGNVDAMYQAALRCGGYTRRS